MERKSSQLGRGAKGKITQYPTDLYALGSKSSAVLNREDVKRSMHGKPTPRKELSSLGYTIILEYIFN